MGKQRRAKNARRLNREAEAQLRSADALGELPLCMRECPSCRALARRVAYGEEISGDAAYAYSRYLAEGLLEMNVRPAAGMLGALGEELSGARQTVPPLVFVCGECRALGFTSFDLFLACAAGYTRTFTEYLWPLGQNREKLLSPADRLDLHRYLSDLREGSPT